MGCICKVKWENDKKQWVKDKKFDYLIIILYTAKWPKANEWGNGKNQMNKGMTKTNEWGNDRSNE